MRARSLIGTLAVATLGTTLLANPASAQDRDKPRSDAEWLEDCRDNWNDDDEIHCELRTRGAKASGATISVNGRRNGGVSITGWDRDSIHIRAMISTRARTEARAKELASAVTTDLAAATLAADGPNTSGRDSWWVSYDIMVPRRSNISIETVNGPIDVENVTGNIELEATNGPIVLSGVGGDVKSRTQNGPIMVELTGKKWEGAGLDASTQNGPVQLSIPKGYSAELETGTHNGPMDFGLPITLQGRINPRKITTTLGSGGARIRAVTHNGPVVVDED